MVIGVLQFELLIHDAASLKDKRRVVSSLKDRLHREHMVSVAEVGMQDRMDVAGMGLVLVGADGRYVGQVLDRICAKLRAQPDAELGDCSREILHSWQGETPADAPSAEARRDVELGDDAELAEELRRYAGPDAKKETP